MKNQIRLIGAMLCLIALTGCGLFQADKPIVIIESPPSGSQFHEGEEISVQSASTDKKAVVRVELVVDGNVVDVDPSPTAQGQPHFTLVQQWKAATQGQHTLLVRAYNAAGQMSDPAGVNVNVLQATAQSSAPQPQPQQQPTATSTPVPPTATPTTAPGQPPAPPPPPACTNNSAFVADVTIPDGTSIPPGGAFTKTWRFSNNGTCTWGAGYQFVFVAGEAMTANTVVQVPQTAPGGTADFSIAMTASTTPGTHVGKWQLRTASALFGQIGNVTISVPAPPPPSSSGCSGSPNIASFTADKTSSALATNVTLSWGAVTNAESVEIDNGIGGVAAPGSTSVYVTSTKTWTMTAKCGANNVSKQVTVKITGLSSIGSIAINPALLASLVFHVTDSSLSAIPNPGFCLSGNKQSVAFLAEITVNNPGTLKYQWEFSDGTNGGSQQITYAAAGKQSVSISHTFSSSGWALLNFISPDDPNSAKAFFTKNCFSFPFP